jgi:hypothetical protein
MDQLEIDVKIFTPPFFLSNYHSTEIHQWDQDLSLIQVI